MIKAEEFARQQLNNSPVYDYKVIAKLLQDFHSQFRPSDEEIDMLALSGLNEWMHDSQFSTEQTMKRILTSLRDKIFKAEI